MDGTVELAQKCDIRPFISTVEVGYRKLYECLNIPQISKRAFKVSENTNILLASTFLKTTEFFPTQELFMFSSLAIK
jgi:hypothetical protein